MRRRVLELYLWVIVKLVDSVIEDVERRRPSLRR